MKKVIPVLIILLIVYLLYKWWAAQENGNGSGTGSTINCDKCVNDVPQTFQHSGTTCPSGSMPSGQGNPCAVLPPVQPNTTIINPAPIITGNISAPQNPMMRGIPAGAEDEVMEPIVVDPANPNTPVVLYPNENIVHPVLPFSETTLSIGTCPNPLNNNSNYISILTGSPMSTTGLMQFLNLMRNGYNNKGGCRFLRKRQWRHHSDLAQTPASSSHISSPNHRAIKQAKLDFLTATINNCCSPTTTTNGCNNCDNLNETQG